jgi:predicted HD superfamily hydrolase involved in NAD metabolism
LPFIGDIVADKGQKKFSALWERQSEKVSIELGHGLRAAVQAFLVGHDHPGTLAHVERVADEAVRLARRFEVDAVAAEQAGLLHDISVVIPAAQRLETARRWGLEICPEEEAFPLLLHQRLSAILARKVFGMHGEAVLEAVGCHTTLRGGSTRLDQVLFVADKIAWDQAGPPPYLAGLQGALEDSLEQAARFYLEYLREHAGGPLHPWALAALLEL